MYCRYTLYVDTVSKTAHPRLYALPVAAALYTTQVSKQTVRLCKDPKQATIVFSKSTLELDL